VNRLLAAALLSILILPAQAQEVVLDNSSAAFSTVGSWPASTAVAGFEGTNYQTHEANGIAPSAIVVDNGNSGFSVTGTWAASTAVKGYLGVNYQHHYANGEPPDASVTDNTSGTATGTWNNSASVAGYYGANYQTHAAGTGTANFSWSVGVVSPGSYEVYARWTAHPNRATNAKYTVIHASGQDTVTVNQQINSGSWQRLGTYSFNAGNATVSLSDDANGYVIADAVMLVPPGAAPNTATWTFSPPSSGSYAVYARWTQHANRASDAKYTVNHAGGASQIVVNQKQGGGTWNLLGNFTFDAGSARVTLTDQADGYVIADAVMLIPSGAPPNSATWTPNVAQGGTYELYAKWTAHPNRATDATYTVTHAQGATPVTVNQQTNGGQWNLLGTFTLNPGSTHNVTLTDQANGYVIADAVRLVPVNVQPQSKLYFIHVDHLNTPRLVADAIGTTVWRWDQVEPFGDSPANDDPDGNSVAFEIPLRLPGQYFDKETNLHYNYFRDYDPAIERYIQSDPIGLRGGVNTYAYVGGNPVGQSDRLGLDYPFMYPQMNRMLNGTAQNYCAAHISVRAPDFINFQVDYYVGSIWGTFSRSGNSFVGVGLNRTYINPVSAGASMAAGWLNSQNPTAVQVDSFISGYSGGATAAYAGMGGGLFYSPGNGSATVIGLGVAAQPGGAPSNWSGSIVGGRTFLQGQSGIRW